MRPHADISHALNGRVRDWAEEQDLSLPEAYRIIIETGLEVVEEGDDEVEDVPDDPEGVADAVAAEIENVENSS